VIVCCMWESLQWVLVERVCDVFATLKFFFGSECILCLGLFVVGWRSACLLCVGLFRVGLGE